MRVCACPECGHIGEFTEVSVEEAKGVECGHIVSESELPASFDENPED